MATTGSLGKFRICIPSYKRAETLHSKTLAFLEKCGVHPDQIDIFVASDAEQHTYRRVLGPGYTLIVGVVGIHHQREFIHNYYPEGEWILCMDDDITTLKTIYKGVPFDVLVESFFEFAEAHGCRLWGIHPNDHGLQLADRAVIGLSFIIGCCFGMINWRGTEYPSQTTEDWTRTICAFELDGAVCRFDGVGPTTRYSTEPGGLQEYRTAARQDREMQALVARWPEYLRLRRRAVRLTDVQIRRRPCTAVLYPFGV